MLDESLLTASVGAQAGLQQEWAGLYARTVSAYLQLSRPSDACAIAEGSKSRVLTALAGRREFPAPSRIPPHLVRQEQDLTSRLTALDAAAFARLGLSAAGETSSTALQRLEERRDLVTRLRAVWQEMEGYGAEAAAYVALRRGDRPTWDDLSALAARLGPETALLSLFTTGERTVLFILRAGMDGPQVVETGLDGAGWSDLLRRFLREVHVDDPGGRRGETWARPLRPLLEAAAPHLAGAARIVFAPQAGGHYLPWGALLEMPLASIPALALLRQLLERPAEAGDGALVVGNPLGDLPYAAAEAREVAEMWGVQPLIGRQATKEAVLKQLEAGGRPLQAAHFATHAYFDPDSPLDSGIVLADGVLTAREVLARDLRAPGFLALSACQTGMAGTLGGDEVAGLSQAWLYAGARTLLVSLWAVDDPSTAHLMTGFYRRWRAGGQDKATALWAAMDETRRARPEWAHTRYWGAFTLVGDWR